MGTVPKHRRHSWARVTSFALLTLILPLVLAACGGGSSATTAPTAAATKPAATTGAGATTAPAATGAPSASTTASSTTASASTTASSTTAAGSTTAGATTATTASTGADPRGVAPTKRGGGGVLKLLYWQAPTILNVHLAQGTKDDLAGSIVEETLASISINSATPDVPILAKEIPSAANGGLAADGKSVTWKLKDGVKWSDGTPMTSADVKATWQYVVTPETGANTLSNYTNIATIDTPDATTVKITFKNATPLWYFPFVGVSGPILQKAQTEKCLADQKNCAINTAPIGTGAFKVKSFISGDNVQYVMNENYREPNAPFFDAIDLKGGGDAPTAAKAVQTGQVDFAWNLQVAPEILKQVTDAGKVLDTPPGGGVERVLFNFTDPNKDVDGEKSSIKAPHPFFSDPKVREAFSWLMDRDSMAKNLYGAAGNPTCNIIPSVPPQTNSKNTKCGFDVAKANQLLDDAGWKKGSDGIRAKNGVQMKLTFSTSVNAVREKEEQVMKQSFQQAGITMDIKNADAGVFFGQPDNVDASSRFEKDMEMYTNSPGIPDAESYLDGWTTANIAQKANGWKLTNNSRYSDPKYDAIVDQLKKELNPEKRAQLQIQANDYLINNFVVLPIIDRTSVNGHRADLINTNPTPWDWNVWNIAYWQIKK